MDDLLCFTDPEKTRIVLQFNEAVRNAGEVLYEVHPYPENPRVFYIDFYDLRPYFADQPLPVGDGLLQQVEIDNFPDRNAIRLIFVIQDASIFDRFDIRPDGQSLVIDLLRHGAQQFDAGEFIDQPLMGQRRIVVIDPGHGGSDPGAVSPFRVGGRTIQEKDVNLAIARVVRQRLNATGFFDARLTRSDDRFMSLDDRVEFAQRMNAEVFISIHANDAGNPDRYREARGLELYFLDTAGARRHAGQMLSEMSNGHRESRDQLGDLVIGRASEQLQSSYNLCAAISMAFRIHRYWKAQREGGDGWYRGIFRGNFAVLRNFDMPCVLVETGFITNPEECRHLINPEFQATVAQNIVDGLIVYYHTRERSGG
ncbi:N-acetylmuramoyl-L-alanine amidase [Candidatus Sumerlaeota bacterium]|nr:N-acetylmuramoyl-L-alanine amidase [Candidatus Sumerlaeota bacterium]